jgi:hypothetical protein
LNSYLQQNKKKVCFYFCVYDKFQKFIPLLVAVELVPVVDVVVFVTDVVVVFVTDVVVVFVTDVVVVFDADVVVVFVDVVVVPIIYI